MKTIRNLWSIAVSAFVLFNAYKQIRNMFGKNNKQNSKT